MTLNYSSFVHFRFIILKIEEGSQSGTSALGNPASDSHATESKADEIASVKPNTNTNEVCKENSKSNNISYRDFSQ